MMMSSSTPSYYYYQAEAVADPKQVDGGTSLALIAEEGRINASARKTCGLALLVALCAGAVTFVLCFLKSGELFDSGIFKEALTTLRFDLSKCTTYTDFTCPNGDTVALDPDTCAYEACPVRVPVGNNRFFMMESGHNGATKGEWYFYAICGLGDDATAYNTIIHDTGVSKKKLKEGGESFNVASFAVCEDGSEPAYTAAKNSKISNLVNEELVNELNILRNTNCAQEGLLRYKLWELMKAASVDDQGYPVHISAKLIRMIFHDIFDYNNIQDAGGKALPTPSGGGDFCLLTPPGAGREGQFNFGLQTEIENFVQDIQDATINDIEILQYFTKADMITMGAEIAIEQHDGPAIGGFASGRLLGNCTYPICFEEECDEMNQFLILAPSDDTWEQSDNNVIFNHLGFQDQSEIVAMMGAHTLGGSNWGITARGDFCPLLSQPFNFSTDYNNAHLTQANVSKDFLGSWFDTTPGIFDVDFFRMIQTMPGRPDELPTDEGTFSDYNRRLNTENQDDTDLAKQTRREEFLLENQETETSRGNLVLGSSIIYHYDDLIDAMNDLQLVNCLDEEGRTARNSDKCQKDPFFPFNTEDMAAPTDAEGYSMQMWCDYCENNDTHCLPNEEVRAGGYHLSNKFLDGAYQIGDSSRLVRKVVAFHNDIALSWDAESRAWVDAFAADTDLFFEKFAGVFHKMQALTHSELAYCSQVECAHDGAGALTCAVEEVASASHDEVVVFSDCDTGAALCYLTGWKGLDLGVFDCEGAEVECYASEYPNQF